MPTPKQCEVLELMKDGAKLAYGPIGAWRWGWSTENHPTHRVMGTDIPAPAIPESTVNALLRRGWIRVVVSNTWFTAQQFAITGAGLAAIGAPTNTNTGVPSEPAKEE